jgi:enolase
MVITFIDARQILDSRGNPTVECSITLSDGSSVSASVPSGASVGSHEAKELRDGESGYHGKGVLHAVHNIKNSIAPSLIGKTPDILHADKTMQALDGTAHCGNLGANAMLAVSIAMIRAQALVEKMELYALINGLWGFSPPSMPRCMFNVINGGMHASTGGLTFQEFLLIPDTGNFGKDLALADDLYQELKIVLDKHSYGSATGDEGGFVPCLPRANLPPEEVVLKLLTGVIQQHSGASGVVGLGLDVAATHFYDAAKQQYRVHEDLLTADNLLVWQQDLVRQFSLISIEDGFAEDDWLAWQRCTRSLGTDVQLVGDDLFATNIARIKQGLVFRAGNAVLIKPNQIGTVSGAVEAIQFCQQQGLATVVSHRSGETDDTFIADLAVGAAAGQLKAGAPARGERVAKYNRLLFIADQLGL